MLYCVWYFSFKKTEATYNQGLVEDDKCTGPQIKGAPEFLGSFQCNIYNLSLTILIGRTK